LNYNNYKDISQFLLNSKNIVLSTHKNPDGDTLGSALGLYFILKSLNKQVRLITPEQASDNLQWLPSYASFVVYKSEQAGVEQLISDADLLVHIDYNAFHRTGDDMAQIFEQSKNAKHIIIDHHPNPQSGFAAYVSDPSACATAQLIYNLAAFMKVDLDQNIATCLYSAIITDTGSFSYGMEDEKPYLVAAALVKTGIDDRWIHQKIYSDNSLDRLQLIGFAISSKLVVNKAERWAYISLTKEELERYHYKSGYTEGLVNEALSIQNIVAAVLLTEKEGIIRLSFRSKSNLPINNIARKYFDGGGHINAAGGNSSDSMPVTIERLKHHMHVYKEVLNKVEL